MNAELKPGVYQAFVSDYGVSNAKSGAPVVHVKFTTGNSTITWNGSLAEGKAQEITLKSLLVLGLQSVDRLHELADGRLSALLDETKPVQIDVQPETYDGKTYLRVKWINEVGFKNAIGKDDFKSKLASLNVRATFAQVKQEAGKPKAAAPKKMTDQEIVDSLPF